MTGTLSAGAQAASDPAADRSVAAVEARAIRRNFGTGAAQVAALGPLDMRIDEGEFVCVVGPSGCGKSTFLRVIAGITAPSAGELDIRVRGTGGVPMAMVFQDHGIYPWKTVEANVRFALRVAGVGRAAARERVAYWLDRMGLTDFATAYPGTLSGGMRQRVGIARALALEPEILLMDEPFAALDAQLRQVLQEELLALWEADRRSVVFVTHSLEEALLLGDRIVVMSARPGTIVRSVRVPFGRPRTGAVRDSAEFAALKAQLWDCLRREVDAYLATVRSAEGQA